MLVSTDPTLWLEFVNTEVMEDGERVDRLPDSRALAGWLSDHGLPTEGVSATDGAAAHRVAMELRAALRAQAARMARGRPPSGAGARAVNAVFATAPLVVQVVGKGGSYRSAWRVGGDAPAATLFPVADSFRAFLEAADPTLVRRCSNPACILYFYDATKNKSRRWCSMQTCGNRAKGAAFYRRRPRRPRGQRRQ